MAEFALVCLFQPPKVACDGDDDTIETIAKLPSPPSVIVSKDDSVHASENAEAAELPVNVLQLTVESSDTTNNAEICALIDGQAEERYDENSHTNESHVKQTDGGCCQANNIERDFDEEKRDVADDVKHVTEPISEKNVAITAECDSETSSQSQIEQNHCASIDTKPITAPVVLEEIAVNAMKHEASTHPQIKTDDYATSFVESITAPSISEETASNAEPSCYMGGE